MRNKAFAVFHNGLVPLTDIELVDEKQFIKRGKLLEGSPEAKAYQFPIVYFTFCDQPQIDGQLPPFYELPEELFGVKVLLVPKHKIVLQYQPEGTILVAQPDFQNRRRPLGAN